MAKKLLLNNELNIGDEELDPTYNYYVFNTSLASGTRITLQNYRAGDTTDWNGLTDWGDGCIDSLLTHKYAENGVYIVKTKYMINKGDEKTGDSGDANTRSMLIACNNVNKNITIISCLFANCGNLVTVNLSLIDTSKSTSMYKTFYGCYYLKSLDLSHFNTSNMTTMKYAFYDCISLHTLITKGWNTSKVIDMSNMFYNCPSGDAAADFDVSNVIDMSGMFWHSFIRRIDKFGKWNTSSAINMKNMFREVNSPDIDFSDWDVSNVTNMSYMFASIDYRITVNGWNVSNVVDMSYMFADNSWESMQIFINNWDINDTVKTDYMFTGLYDDPDYHVYYSGVSAEDWARMTALY